ncbi:MAG: formylglycine-generating enzyme family protein [bacterium]|nr:formylglycine-generating enzyme family protein [bacterium]
MKRFKISCLLLLIFFLIPGIAQAKPARLFIKTFEAKQGVSASLAEEFHDKLVLYFFQETAGKYRVISETDIKVMYQQAEQMMSNNCDETQCLTQIASILDADLIVYGKLEERQGKLRVFSQALKRDRTTKEPDKNSVVEAEFDRSGLGWYAREIVRKLIKPEYSMEAAVTAESVKDLSGLKKPPAEWGKPPGLQPLNVPADSAAMAMISDYAQSLVSEGDGYYTNKEYENASRKYRQALEAMETKVPRSKQEELAGFRSSVEGRIAASYGMYLKERMGEPEKSLRREKYEEALYGYEKINDEFRRSGLSSREKPADIRTFIRERLDALCLLTAGQAVQKAVFFYSQFKFSEALIKYSEAEQLLEKVSDKEEPKYKKSAADLAAGKKQAEETAYSYFRNTVLSYFDRTDYYNSSGRKEKAAETLAQARNYILSSSWCNDTEAVKDYNERANILNADRLTGQDCPGIAALSGREETKTVGGIPFVYVPSGSFLMGSGDNDREASKNEKPRHKVEVTGFWMGRYEVTQDQYRKIMDENPSKIKGGSLPVERVSWEEADKFCRKFSKLYKVKARLPTEAEWEYACRAGSTNIYYWGDVLSDDYAWSSQNSKGDLHPAGRKKPNPWGLYDMLGNVWEWCLDWYDGGYYKESPAKDPKGPESGSRKVLRGGSANNSATIFDSKTIRIAYRAVGLPYSNWYYHGFRIVILKE